MAASIWRILSGETLLGVVKMEWKKGRGKLGPFDPLLGKWRAKADSTMGKVVCTREFRKILEGSHVVLEAHWNTGGKIYLEQAVIGVNSEKEICFWSFTSDGKQSQGRLADVTDVHPKAIGFEAKMPAGLARMVYWPDESEGFRWVVESKTKKGWNRFVEHHYLPVS
ncbi:MAG: hypothetical protein OEY63_01910 [Gemmatimonadota bacterium]|nr:hypothetical protein [Gemmatimonadota bacterium]